MLGLDFKVVSAIFRKDMRISLGSVTGWVFIVLFIFATSAAMVLVEDFFVRNLADLATLNEWMPYILLLFVPAITMNAWADERRSGTDELVLTLPVRDGEVVLGKYLGVLGMFTLALALTALGQLVGLAKVGDPDKGLMFASFAGYWLMGALFVAISLVGSMLTLNVAVAFILGLVGCSLVVVIGMLPWASAMVGVVLIGLVLALIGYTVRGTATWAAVFGLVGALASALAWLWGGGADTPEAAPASEGATTAGTTSGVLEPTFGDRFEKVFEALSVHDHFASFGEGVVRLGDVLYFVGGAALMLYVCGFLLGRRLW